MFFNNKASFMFNTIFSYKPELRNAIYNAIGTSIAYTVPLCLRMLASSALSQVITVPKYCIGAYKCQLNPIKNYYFVSFIECPLVVVFVSLRLILSILPNWLREMYADRVRKINA